EGELYYSVLELQISLQETRSPLFIPIASPILTAGRRRIWSATPSRPIRCQPILIPTANKPSLRVASQPTVPECRRLGLTPAHSLILLLGRSEMWDVTPSKDLGTRSGTSPSSRYSPSRRGPGSSSALNFLTCSITPICNLPSPDLIIRSTP